MQSKKHHVLIVIGGVFLVMAFGFAMRIIWEETLLTWRDGPQMIGFSLAHGEWAFLMLSPVLLAGWSAIALIVIIVERFRKFAARKALTGVMIASLFVLGLLSIPEAF